VKAHHVLETHLRLLEALEDVPLSDYLNFLTRKDTMVKGFNGEVTLATFIGVGVAQSETVWLTSDVVDEIIPTAYSYTDGSIVDESMIPEVSFGVGVLDKPLVYKDVFGRDEIVHFVTWSMIFVEDTEGIFVGQRRAMQIMLWNDGHRGLDGGALEQVGKWREKRETYNFVERAKGCFPIKQFTFLPEFVSIGPMEGDLTDEYFDHYTELGYKPKRDFINNGRVALAILDLIARVPLPPEGEETAADVKMTGKSITRRAVKRGIAPSVRVAPLHRERRPRREPDPNREKRTRRPVEHQVHVREHTRMQAYGPGRSLRKEIVIEAYDYGPEDEPGHVRPPTVYTVGKGDTSGR
jgi:hypothetical protein